MGWLQRLFGQKKPQDAQVNPIPQQVQQSPQQADENLSRLYN
ncbi:hypothetical protein [Calothrix sp. UHCC 0171]